MRNTGIVRRVDDLGRIVIPMELRRTLGIKVGDPMQIFVEGERIILEKHVEGCVLCGEGEGLAEIEIAGEPKRFCQACIKTVKDLPSGEGE